MQTSRDMNGTDSVLGEVVYWFSLRQQYVASWDSSL